MQEEPPRTAPLGEEAGSTVSLRKDEMIGRVLGSWRVVKLLGEGGMGAVYMGEHPAIGSKVAIKVLHPRYAADQRIVERFFNEARAVNIIGHDNIVKILDFNVADGSRHYFVMDFLHGRTLQSIVQPGAPVPLRRMAPILLQCCRALQAAHEHGIVHRDFKPENVFLIDQGDRTDFVKLVDFGIAKLNESAGGVHTQTGAVMGTPAYMSPEQAGGEPVIDARSDIYSLGVAMFQMGTGKLPFADAGPSFGKLLAAHLQQPPPLPRSINPDVPEELEAIILKTLEKDPARRHQSMAELHDALAGCMERLGISTELPRIGETAAAPDLAPGSTPRHSGALPTPVRGATVARTQRVPAGEIPRRSSAFAFGAALAAIVVLFGGALALWQYRRTLSAEQARAVEQSKRAPAPEPNQHARTPAPATPGTDARAATPSTPAAPQGPASSSPRQRAGENAVRDTPAPPGPRPNMRTRTSAAQGGPAQATQRSGEAAATASRPATTSVSFRCAGPQEVCGPLRAAVDEALSKRALRSVRDPARADVSIEAAVAGVDGRASAQFGTTFAVRTYSIDVTAEAPRTSEAVAMPASTTLSYDPAFGTERVAEKSRVLAGDIGDAVIAFVARQRR